MYNLNNLNMKYVQANRNDAWENGATLECLPCWTINTLSEWLPDYDYDMLQSVLDWIKCPHHIAEGLYLKVWCD